MSEEGPVPAGARLPRTVTVTWEPDHRRFVAAGTFPGRAITLNAPRPEGLPATGFSPAELVLAGAGACSAWDVVAILGKARQELTGLTVEVVGTQEAEPPSPFRDLRLHYVVRGRHLEPEIVGRAVRLSHERYCSVIATIREAATIAYTIEIEPDPGDLGPPDAGP